VKLPDKLFEQMDRLIELELEKVELLRKLKRAYMLANVVGVHPNQIKGKLAVRVYESGRMVAPWQGTEFAVQLDGEEVARKKLTDVPLDLWPDDVRAKYERHKKREKKLMTTFDKEYVKARLSGQCPLPSSHTTAAMSPRSTTYTRP